MPSSEATVTLNPEVSLHPLGDEAVLFLGHKGQVLLLSPSAALMCRGLEAGLSVREIAETLARSSGASPEAVADDLRRLTDALREAGAMDAPAEPPGGSAAPERLPAPPPVRASGEAGPEARHYGLVDFRFALRTPDPAIARLADALLGHLERSADSGDAVLEVARIGRRWVLMRDGVALDVCTDTDQIAPLLHANIVMAAYWSSDCLAAVHGAAVTRGDDCVLMPAVSGRGKTTLTAALLASGWGYCTDDLALLDGDPLRLRAVPTCLGLKRGSWDVLAGVFPQIEDLPVHIRADGKEVRYLAPPASVLPPPEADSYRVRAVVLPAYEQEGKTRLLGISPGEGLKRLTQAGYDLPRRLDRRSLTRLIDWISDIPCFELRYGRLDEAVLTLPDVLP